MSFNTLQAFCVVISAYTTEIFIMFQYTSSTYYSFDPVAEICYNNPIAKESGHRICHSLMATAISSIMVCMMLMIIDLFIPCVNTMVMISIINSYMRS